MQHCIPEGIGNIVGAHLTQDLSRKNEEQDGVLQSWGDIDAGMGLYERRDGKQQNSQKAEEDVLIVLVKQLVYHDENHYQTQQVVHYLRTVAVANHLSEGFPVLSSLEYLHILFLFSPFLGILLGREEEVKSHEAQQVACNPV